MMKSDEPMNKTIRQLEELNQLTRQMNDQLEKEELPLQSIQQMMEQRERCIQQLGAAGQAHRSHLSSPDQKRITRLFDRFEQLDQTFRNLLRESLRQQQFRIAETSRNRQAVKSYRESSERPDISFY